MSAAAAFLGRERKKEWCVTVESSYQPNIDTFPLSFYHVTLDNESLQGAWHKMMILWHLHFRAHLVQQLYYPLLVDREGKQKIIMFFMYSLYYSPPQNTNNYYIFGGSLDAQKFMRNLDWNVFIYVFIYWLLYHIVSYESNQIDI